MVKRGIRKKITPPMRSALTATSTEVIPARGSVAAPAGEPASNGGETAPSALRRISSATNVETASTRKTAQRDQKAGLDRENRGGQHRRRPPERRERRSRDWCARRRGARASRKAASEWPRAARRRARGWARPRPGRARAPKGRTGKRGSRPSTSQVATRDGKFRAAPAPDAHAFVERARPAATTVEKRSSLPVETMASTPVATSRKSETSK